MGVSAISRRYALAAVSEAGDGGLRLFPVDGDRLTRALPSCLSSFKIRLHCRSLFWALGVGGMLDYALHLQYTY